LRRPTLRLTLDCNNACLFCAQRGLNGQPRSASDLRSELDRLRSQADEITFVGGEPTLDRALPEFVAAARERGFRSVGVQTNGRLLADGQVLRTLAAAGLTDLHFSIHGAEAAVHDYHVGAPGAFEAIVAALGFARALGLVSVATTVLTRSNYRVLDDVAVFLKNTGVVGWLISAPRTAGAMGLTEGRLMPRLWMAADPAFRALTRARSAGIPSWIQGLPACVLAPSHAKYRAWMLPDESERAYAAVCQACPSRSQCPGVDEDYLRRFGGDELAHREAAPSPEWPSLTGMFVGVGEIAPAQRPASPVIPPALTPLGVSG
jgi:hypothetical protein